MAKPGTQLTLSGLTHENRGLFSDYYLNDVLPSQPDWKLFVDSAQSIHHQLRDLYLNIKPATLSEAQLEKQWIQPVFGLLGHHFAVQAQIRYREKGYRKPDYLLFKTAKEANDIGSKVYEPREIAHALVVADAKEWGTKLDQGGGADKNNPSEQIHTYLHYSELPWGILTDGCIWRLYEQKTSKRNIYYAVNLPQLLLQEDINAFLYFYAFFRQGAFTENWLQSILKESVDFAENVSDKLEDQVYDALELIAQGFLDYRRNNLEPTPEILRAIYENSLVLLYRLLFIFYAESREILPIRQNDAYTKDHSLTALKQTVARVIDTNDSKGLDADGSSYYTRLKDLFFSIDQGSSRYDLPAYNGKLFSAIDHSFLDTKSVGDSTMAKALDKVARIAIKNTAGKEDRVFVDYRALDVRHLGAIYEKLLEYQLDVAKEPLATVTEQKKIKYVPAGKATKNPVVKQTGQVYLRTDNFERKVTGSYYTPDYIVQFIVEHTIGPLLETVTSQYATRDKSDQWEVKDPEKLKDAILALNILDPATGSGHFLVEAASFTAEWLRSLRLMPGDIADEDELLYWKRRVAVACLYGVDVNPLAVELAKLSLWLTTLAKGKPLSFLDHHIKLGNSLIGTKASEIGFRLIDPLAAKKAKAKQAKEDQQYFSTMEDPHLSNVMSTAVSDMLSIEHRVADQVSDVKRQEEDYHHLSRALEPWKHLANVWTAWFVGSGLSQAEWDQVRQAVTSGSDSTAILTIPAVEKARKLAEDYRFIHWDVLFPEVFYTPDGKTRPEPGFDAVIGNPPYVRQQSLSWIKTYLSTRYEIYHNDADLYLYFYEKALRLLRPDQRLGFITSGTYMNSSSGKPFRRFIHENAAFEQSINFGENQPFKGAEMVYPTITVIRKGKPEKTFRSLFIEGTRVPSSLQSAIENESIDCLSQVTSKSEWRFQAEELTKLFEKIISPHNSLYNFVDKNIYYGVLTGLNDAFVISESRKDEIIREDARSAEIIRPFVRGEDCRPWYQITSGLYLIAARQGIDIDNYPAVRYHLNQYKSRLEPKPLGWKGKWDGRTSGNYEWYEWHDTVSYYQHFERPKVLWAEISKIPRFSLSVSSQYPSNKAGAIVINSNSTLSILNSRIIWFVISQLCVPLRLRGGLWQYQLTHQFIKRLPIPELKSNQDTQLAEIADVVTTLSNSRYQAHESFRHRVRSDLTQHQPLNEKLTSWWTLDFSTFRSELKKAAKVEVPLKERGEWESFLNAQKAEHERLTAEIVSLETRMNQIVYEAFKLTPDEIALIERVTKYKYGEV